MTCIHNNQIKKEIKDFTDKSSNENSYIYKKLDSIVNKVDIKTELEEVEKGGWLFQSKYKTKAIYNPYDFSYFSKEALLDLLKKIDDLANDCDCYESLDSKGKEIENQLAKVDDKLRGKEIESERYKTQV